MRLILLALLTLVTCFTASCASFLGEPGVAPQISATSQKASSAGQFQEIEDWLNKNNLAITAGADGNDYDRSFSQGSILVYAEANASSSFTNPAQKRLTAQRAAEAVAQRNLANYFASHERFGEIHFRTYTVKTEAFIKGATIVAKSYDQGSGRAAVLLKLDLRGAKGFNP